MPLFQTQAEHYKAMNPPVYQAASEAEALKAANEHAKKIGANVSGVNPTGSMEPTLLGGQYTVNAKTPYDQLKEGDIVIYTPKWANGAPIIHRLVQKDKGGWIASGDNNPRSESWERMTPLKYQSKVVGIYSHPAVETKKQHADKQQQNELASTK